MRGWLIDTNVVSELRRSKPVRSVSLFFETQPLEMMHISVASLSELRYGVACVADPDMRKGLSDWIELTVRPLFEGRVLPIDEEVMLVWRIMIQKGRDEDHTFPQPDLIIAATATRHDMVVVSRDHKIFQRAGVPVHNPWIGN